MEEQGGHGRRKEWSTAAATVSAGQYGMCFDIHKEEEVRENSISF